MRSISTLRPAGAGGIAGKPLTRNLHATGSAGSLPRLPAQIRGTMAAVGGPGTGAGGRVKSGTVWGRRRHSIMRNFRLEDLEWGPEIGKGFFGSVFRINHRETKEVMAVKEMKATTDDEGRRNFQHEIQLLRRLNHPNILQYIGVFILKDRGLYLITEYVSGGTLREYIKNRKHDLPWTLRLSFAGDIARGCAYLHHNDIIHRDLTSKNCLIRSDLSLCVADFGLAKVTNHMGMTQVCGSPYWMAPEMLHGKPYAHKADVFSFGIIMGELSARISANPDVFPRTDEFGVAYEQLKALCPPDMPAEYWDLLQRCTGMEPNDRPAFSEATREIDTLAQRLVARFSISDRGRPRSVSMFGGSSTEQLHHERQDSTGGVKPRTRPRPISMLNPTSAQSRSNRATSLSMKRAARLSLLMGSVPSELDALSVSDEAASGETEDAAGAGTGSRARATAKSSEAGLASANSNGGDEGEGGDDENEDGGAETERPDSRQSQQSDGGSGSMLSFPATPNTGVSDSVLMGASGSGRGSGRGHGHGARRPSWGMMSASKSLDELQKESGDLMDPGERSGSPDTPGWTEHQTPSQFPETGGDTELPALSPRVKRRSQSLSDPLYAASATDD